MSFYIPPRPSLSHLSSISSRTVTDSSLPASPRRPVSRSISSSLLSTTNMAAVATAPGLPSSLTRHLSAYNDEDSTMSTIPDPRSRTISPANDNGPPSPSQHPDLNNEVATLSNKLINAINHTTNLDDSLSATRHELEVARERVKFLEQETSDHRELVAKGILVRRSITDIEKVKLQISLSEEKKRRAEVEKEKKAIELELENLTTALFEEANKMVITAREEAQKEQDVVVRRNEQLKAQLADMESLLKNHQEQLADLKRVMEQMAEDREDQNNGTEPSTPGLSNFDSKDDNTDAATDRSSIPEVQIPSYPTSFTHLLQPILRTDLSAYDDFISLVRLSRTTTTSSSRTSSGSYGGIGLGLGLGGYVSQAANAHFPSNGSSSSLSTVGTHGSSPITPITPASAISMTSATGPNVLLPLRETKFYKRALAEDIEPTLRLDTAPGLSWLARRTVINAMCDGSLVVEPMPSSSKPYTFACSLCGETRKDEPHRRTHRFRTSENENAQRYPLCKYCLGRVRSSCDFLGFLRVLKDGHWRTDGEEAERAAWEESVRLREQMFWCRMGGGVIPATASQINDMMKSPRASEDQRKEQEEKLSQELERTGEIKPRDITPMDVCAVPIVSQQQPALTDSNDDTHLEETKEVAGSAVVHEVGMTDSPKAGDSNEDAEENRTDAPVAGENIILTSSSASILQIKPDVEAETDDMKRLSISIPGAFS